MCRAAAAYEPNASLAMLPTADAFVDVVREQVKAKEAEIRQQFSCGRRMTNGRRFLLPQLRSLTLVGLIHSHGRL